MANYSAICEYCGTGLSYRSLESYSIGKIMGHVHKKCFASNSNVRSLVNSVSIRFDNLQTKIDFINASLFTQDEKLNAIRKITQK